VSRTPFEAGGRVIITVHIAASRCARGRFSVGKWRRIFSGLLIAVLGGLWANAHAVTLVAGDVVVLETNSDSVVRVKPGQYDPADKGANQTVITQGNLISNPGDVAIGDGVLYVTDTTNETIVRVDTATGNQSLVDTKVSGTSIDIRPRGIALDSKGKLVVSDRIRFEILEIDPDTGETASLTPNLFLAGPGALALDSQDRIYVLDGSTIVRITPAGQVLERIASGGGYDGIAVDDQSGMVYSSGPSEIFRINPETYTDADPSANRTTVFDDDGEDLGVLANGDLVATRADNTDLLRINPDTGASSIAAEGGNLLITGGLAVVEGTGTGGGGGGDPPTSPDGLPVVLDLLLNDD
jgi:sugar lactone lactonase YvrE